MPGKLFSATLSYQMKQYYVLAYYQIQPIADPRAEVATHKAFFAGRDATSRIYISEQGINGQMSAAQDDAKAYMAWMQGRPEFKDVHFKIHTYHEQAFPRLTIKYRRNLVGYDEPINFEIGGEHVPPKKWKEMLETSKDHILIDVRNDYEWELGRFEGAELPPCETFREFRDYADKLKTDVDPKKTPVMMYCTGGIRCELYSSILMERGFDKVYQLEGGIINYGLKEGSDHWKGKLFVFDDRLSVPISDQEAPVIGKCNTCEAPSESYYNCANIDCNKLFLCCPSCVQKLKGCCQESCMTATRKRPFDPENVHKPFKRWHHYASEQTPAQN